MKTFSSKFILILIISGVLVGLGVYILKKNVGSISIPAKEELPVVASGESISYLQVPDGFRITFFAKDLPGARTMEVDPKGRMLVAQTSKGTITLLEDTDDNGEADTRKIIATGLNNPHGMISRCEEGECVLMVAESTMVSTYVYDLETGTLGTKTKLFDLESSKTDRHFTRSLILDEWGPESAAKLLVSVGSSCNVCEETDEQRGRILSYDFTTKKLETYATGLRNAVFMTRNPLFGKIFATEMGRDGLGDTTPPDEINIIEKGKNYGWPICYGKNIHDTDFDKKTYIRNPCMEPFETPSFIDLGAHVAPLGLSFIQEEGWPEEYWYNLLVAEHGSWNSSTPVGYKVERLKINSKGEYIGKEDFITGWLTADGKKLGRPADIKALPGGTVYITDDMIGAVYKLTKISE